MSGEPSENRLHRGRRRGRTIAFARVGPDSGTYPLFHIKGDLGENNAGLQVFGEDDVPPDYLPWGEVERIDLDLSRTPARSPSPDESRSVPRDAG